MAVLMEDASRDVVNMEQWRVMTEDLQVFTGSLLILGLVNMDTTGAPQVMEGSRFEVNGGKYKCLHDEEVATRTGTGAPATGENYIYAVADGNMAGFVYDNAAPSWDPAKGGWYLGNDRAVVKFYYTGGWYNGKVVLDGLGAMDRTNTRQPVPATGGVQLSSPAIGGTVAHELPRGAYRYEVRGGTGGRGGSSKTASNGGQDGGLGAAGQVLSGVFLVEKKSASVVLGLGGDGNDGERGGGNSGDGDTETGGGGGASGQTSFVVIDGVPKIAAGGSGGGGSSSNGTRNLTTGGGGGAGGYGTAANGSDRGIPDTNGLGGSNGVGGAGGIGMEEGMYGTYTLLSGSGSGTVRGGRASSAITNKLLVSFNGGSQSWTAINPLLMEKTYGGDYGEPGGLGIAFNINNGGMGILPSRPVSTRTERADGTFVPANQAGGSACPFPFALSSAFPGGIGGSGRKGTTSGYARLYRLW